MNILITGGSGLIAGRLLSYLSNRYEIYVYSRSLKMIKGNITLIKHDELDDHILKEIDLVIHSGGPSSTMCNDKQIYDNYKNKDIKWCYSTLDEVKKNIFKFYPDYNESFKFIEGKVETTLKNSKNLPDQISLLRLDTDFYESTKIELETLYPKLSSGGVLIIDDYGHWKGSRKAVDEYFELDKNFMWLHRIDYASRILIKK